MSPKSMDERMGLMPNEDKDIAIKIFDRLGQIDGKLSGLEQIRQRADDAYDQSNKAFGMAEDTDEELKELKTTLKWGFGAVASVLIPFILFVLNFIFV
ncbi:hemolysin XhlA family protein [Salinicoccus roseus]|uniref:hemolysin XhlA family protein n=1 Tax=Salinicoccus roseus TaxID=45670 RepID=UPI001CA79D22|nr:hemolysin XhlA family protein [Salinicoccus roseus]MBY8908219.1 hemolysin XhlA family protein [Salinicoccus roseus]